jgi:hypothetical protein
MYKINWVNFVIHIFLLVLLGLLKKTDCYELSMYAGYEKSEMHKEFWWVRRHLED